MAICFSSHLFAAACWVLSNADALPALILLRDLGLKALDPDREKIGFFPSVGRKGRPCTEKVSDN